MSRRTHNKNIKRHEPEPEDDYDNYYDNYADPDDVEIGAESPNNISNDSDSKPSFSKSFKEFSQNSGEYSKKATSLMQGGGDVLKEPPVGLSENSNKYSLLHHEVLEKTLLEGETVLAQFNVYFPDHFYPMWYIVFWTVITFGFYFVFFVVPRMIRQFLYRIRFCTPAKVDFQKGLMVVTSHGRVIVWKQHGVQHKQERGCLFNCFCLLCVMCCCPVICAAPVKYSMDSSIQVYSAYKMRQMSQFYHSWANCVLIACCSWDFGCCFEYIAGIELSFDQFNHPYNNEESSYFGISKGVVTTKSAAEYAYHGMLDLTRKVAGAFAPPPTIVMVYADTHDIVHAGDLSAIVGECNRLQKRLLDALTSFLPEIVAITEVNGDLEKGNFVSSRETTDIQVICDDGTVNLPREHFPLLPDEDIVSTIGQVHRVTWLEWLMIWKFCENRRKKYVRSLLILTNKRLVEFYLVQRRGALPNDHVQGECSYTSFLPGKILCGFMHSMGKKVTASSRKKVCPLELQLLTEAGVLILGFKNGVEALPFAKALQATPERIAASKALYWDGESLPKHSSVKIDGLDMNAIPIMASERIVFRFQNYNPLAPPHFRPFCKNKCLVNCWQYIWKKKFREGVCSKPACCLGIWPFGVYLCTCALLPLIDNQEILISNSTIYSYSYSRNYGFCGFKTVDGGCECKPGCCQKMGEFLVAWAPVTHLVGYEFDNHVDTNDNFYRRLCSLCCCHSCAAITCPIAKTSFMLKADVGNVKFKVTGEGRNHNWNEDTRLWKFMRLLDSIQRAQLLGTPSTAAPLPAVPLQTTAQAAIVEQPQGLVSAAPSPVEVSIAPSPVGVSAITGSGGKSRSSKPPSILSSSHVESHSSHPAKHTMTAPRRWQPMPSTNNVVTVSSSSPPSLGINAVVRTSTPPVSAASYSTTTSSGGTMKTPSPNLQTRAKPATISLVELQNNPMPMAGRRRSAMVKKEFVDDNSIAML